MQRVTPPQPTQPQKKPPPKTPMGHRLRHVLGAAWLKTARRGQQRRDPPFIPTEDSYPCPCSPRRRKPRSMHREKSPTSSCHGASASSRRTFTTTSTGTSCQRPPPRAKARTRRRHRFRSTAPPTRLVAVTPNLAPPPPPRHRRNTTMKRPTTFTPSLYARVKSSRRRNRSGQGKARG